ncbi:BA14K family protein [Hoeflea sp. YIM 152468]|uniref:BA14K family protein n=1 Tax=Hoeflea sp. YIM 152468 TaxID=3031759 RepID=UPI0023DA9C65|nr:BA14K family protein [Hoeflea sp. YIM 152468]MDF1606793.1 BA14K family protein [Hoeflea sp. YIM 152468]
MLKTLMKTLVSASFCLATIAPAAAVPVMLQKPVVQISGETDVVQVRHKRRGFHRHNNRGYYNGHRGHRTYRRGYRRHNGYWFPPAAFALGAIIGGAMNNNHGNVRPGYTNPQHVNWCHNKYRSYRQRDNSFQPYHGPRRECRSPFY